MNNWIDGDLVHGALERTLESMCFVCVLGVVQDWTPQSSDRTVEVQCSGDWAGKLWVQAPAATCSAMASAFLGESPEETEMESSQAVLGELANVILGSMLGSAQPNGHFDLTPPRSVPGIPDAAVFTKAYELDCGSLRVALTGH